MIYHSGFGPFFIVFVAAVLLFLLAATASQRRRFSTATRLCRGCGASHPAYATFCRRCGRRL